MSKDRVRTISLIAATAIGERLFVVIDSAGKAAIAGAAADAHGISSAAAAAADDPIAVELLDGSRTEVTAGAAVSAGDEIATDASGRAVTAVATNPINGVAITAAAAAGEIIDIITTKGAGVV